MKKKLPVLVRMCAKRFNEHDGRCIVWLGVRKSTGRGEGLSKLHFDYLAPVLYTPPDV